MKVKKESLWFIFDSKSRQQWSMLSYQNFCELMAAWTRDHLKLIYVWQATWPQWMKFLDQAELIEYYDQLMTPPPLPEKGEEVDAYEKAAGEILKIDEKIPSEMEVQTEVIAEETEVVSLETEVATEDTEAAVLESEVVVEETEISQSEITNQNNEEQLDEQLEENLVEPTEEHVIVQAEDQIKVQAEESTADKSTAEEISDEPEMDNVNELATAAGADEEMDHEVVHLVDLDVDAAVENIIEKPKKLVEDRTIDPSERYHLTMKIMLRKQKNKFATQTSHISLDKIYLSQNIPEELNEGEIDVFIIHEQMNSFIPMKGEFEGETNSVSLKIQNLKKTDVEKWQHWILEALDQARENELELAA